MHTEDYQEKELLILLVGTGFLNQKNSFHPHKMSIKPHFLSINLGFPRKRETSPEASLRGNP